MRAGGGAAKGADFERTACLALSLWVSGGARSDLFVRNVLSGGRFTLALARKEDHGTPGDVMAAHPTAFAFSKLFLVECKSYADLNWPTFLYDPAKSFLGRTIVGCEKQALPGRQYYMVIAKQNKRKPMVITSGAVGLLAMGAAWPKGSIDHHLLHKGQYSVMPFQQMLDHINPTRLLTGLQAQRQSNVDALPRTLERVARV